MKADRVGFALGVLALGAGGLALWANYGTIDWRLVGLVAPIGLVVIGIGMLALTKAHH
jgi:hypothetical protein